MQSLLFIFSLIFFNYVFCANIAVIGWCKEDSFCLEQVSKELTPLGHKVSLAWEGDDLEAFDLIVSSNAKYFLKPYKAKTILSCYEPPVIVSSHGNFEEMSKYLSVFSWNHDLYNGKNFEKFYYPCGHVVHKNDPFLAPFDKRKLACLVSSYLSKPYPNELYTIRRNIVKFYNRYYRDDFSLYGQRGWKFGFRPVYKGETNDKDGVLRSHKFIYCFENWDNNYHYISEKIFDAFNSLCVPIYLGSSRILDFIPKETFIDARSFRNIQELHNFIAKMDEQTYMNYIKAIVSFSRSDIVKKFTKEYHQNQIVEKIKQYLPLCK